MGDVGTGAGGPTAASGYSAPAPAPPPPPPGPAGGPPQGTPANITVVRTAAELQRATLSGAVDIEIRAHLDLRTLRLAPNPDIPGTEPPNNRREIALLYATLGLRSIRGNCSEPDPVAALDLTEADSADLLPLRPYQCLLMVDQTVLMVNGGHVWIDNVYMKLSRRLVRPDFTFITAGALDGEFTWPEFQRSNIFVTGTTFQAEHRGNARAMLTDITGVSLYVDDCVFTDWAGILSPFTIKFQGLGNIRNTVFRNMYLHVEIADLSYEGIVRFENVSFANVTLQHGDVVGTTLNDYQQAVGYYLTYYAEDDEAFDVDPEPVPPAESGVFGVEFVIIDDTMSDCLYLLARSGTVFPGCPQSSLQARSNVIDRGFDSGEERTSTGVPYAFLYPFSDYAFSPVVVGPAGAGYSYDYSFGPSSAGYVDYGATGDVYVGGVPFGGDYDEAARFDYAIVNDPELRFQDILLQENNTWLAATRQVLPQLPAAPWWPPFELDPPPQPRNRSSLLPDRGMDSAAARRSVNQLVPPLQLQGSPPPGKTHHQQTFFVPFLAALAVALVAVTCSCLLARPWLQRLRTAAQLRRAKRSRKGRPASALETAALGRTGHPAETSRARTPLTPMNPDYEYVLPPQLALFARAQTATASTGPGGTVVLPPYTVSTIALAEGEAMASDSSQGGEGLRANSCPVVGGPTANGFVSVGQRSPVATRHKSRQAVVKGARAARSSGAPLHQSKQHRTLSRRAVSAAAARAAQEAERRLHEQLNSFRKDDVLLARFEVLGRRHRRRGGQAVVQFVVDINERCEYAIKFFLDRDAFLTEAALYTACFPSVRSTGPPPVASPNATHHTNHCVAEIIEVAVRFLPHVEAVCGAAAPGLEDPRGEALPPCIVMEKGESLHDWSDRAQPDLFTSLAVLSNISKRLADMHDVGYVHRDLKPANVMWLPRRNRWTVIDFGCTVRVGELAPLSFTLAYAAPEVAAAYQRQEKRMVARTALDAWSLGVMAFEILTGAPAFNLLEDGVPGVTARLLGELPLPWEGALGADVVHKLGVLQEPVLQLLRREPSERTPMRKFHAACVDIFARHAMPAAHALPV